MRRGLPQAALSIDREAERMRQMPTLLEIAKFATLGVWITVKMAGQEKRVEQRHERVRRGNRRRYLQPTHAKRFQVSRMRSVATRSQ